MQSFICITCGVGHAPSATPPSRCPICEDERQYVNGNGQGWTTLAELQAAHQNDIREQEPGLYGIGATPQIGIGQRALYIQQPGGGVLWDCTPLVTDAAVAEIKGLGGLRAIAISHPHFYASMVDWSEAFGGVPIHLHEANRQYVMRPSEHIAYWSGETLDLGQGVTLVRSGGHFVGSSVLHWVAGAGGKGVLMISTQIHLTAHVGRYKGQVAWCRRTSAKFKHLIDGPDSKLLDPILHHKISAGQVAVAAAGKSHAR